MTDLLKILPELDIAAFTNLLPSLEKHHITTADLLTLDAVIIAKRAQLPAREIRRLSDTVLKSLQCQYDLRNDNRDGSISAGKPCLLTSGLDLLSQWQTISVLDPQLDAALGGGIPTSYVTEITGESGMGKTQFLLTLLLSVQLPPPRGLDRSAIYISTESPLPTKRLAQILSTHPQLSNMSPTSADSNQKPTEESVSNQATTPTRNTATQPYNGPSLSRILSIQTPDLESQDHILRYQLPVAIQRHNVGLVVIDSITANYRAEFDTSSNNNSSNNPYATAQAMATRTAQLTALGALLRSLAVTHDVAIVVANQVADRFEPLPTAPPPPSSSLSSSSPPMSSLSSQRAGTANPSPAPASLTTSTTATTTPSANTLTFPIPPTLDHQQRWFTGWGDAPPPPPVRSSSSSSTLPAPGLKTPSLGLVWTTQLAGRIALVSGEGLRAAEPRTGDTLTAANACSSSTAAAGGEGERGAEAVRTGGSSNSTTTTTSTSTSGKRLRRRCMRVVFAAWAGPVDVGFEVWAGGVRGV